MAAFSLLTKMFVEDSGRSYTARAMIGVEEVRFSVKAADLWTPGEVYLNHCRDVNDENSRRYYYPLSRRVVAEREFIEALQDAVLAAGYQRR